MNFKPPPSVSARNHVRRCALLAALLALGACTAISQPGGATGPTAADASATASSADAMIAAGARVLAQFDAQQAAAVWDAAPDFVKRQVSRDTFVKNVTQQRQAMGPIAQRGWAMVSRQIRTAASAQLPAGEYGNVRFEALLKSGSVTAETVSMAREGNAWRFVGYVPSPVR